jgi:hypothetical protein
LVVEKFDVLFGERIAAQPAHERSQPDSITACKYDGETISLRE